MEKYTAYINTLDAILESIEWGRCVFDNELVHFHLNGGAASELRTLVNRHQLRNSGAFFTGEKLARQMVQLIAPKNYGDTSAWDPNCGAGDLLLRWSERLRLINGDLEATLLHWEKRLYGVEIHPEFLQVAKRRLILAAVSRGAKLKHGQLVPDNFFKGLICHDLLHGDMCIPDKAVILMNPPFTMIETPEDCYNWSSGKVAFAAVAFLNCLKLARSGQQIIAILPDVLRSGSRYERWRKLVSQYASSAKVKVVGRFSNEADVDVFILHAISGKAGHTNIVWFQQSSRQDTHALGDICEVRVGTVVPHRHTQEGPKVAYLTTADSPPWRELKNLASTIRYSGTCVNGPFLAVRRTSSPSDINRAITTIINYSGSVAVENHLITLRPLDGKIQTCRRIQKHLRSEKVREWLDGRIRCRHLTVSSLREIPISPNDCP
ncbi:N-6 DNA methylase [Prosthecobacter dejongeii]|uniref:site-specific DNA-methyltransferase (adenine-specific) n=1 Tax=Prosthecobacter dejongeii TaxID=48465 RepID=A0A7W8DND2_9BACT|nr:N-6 DNA methylase [Prosthecobacter dejongeii]MBB5036424.1 hypothetical protein [Prosthecobacter dejongeii]